MDLPAVALEIFADAACTTKMTEIIVPHVDCRTPDDRASSKTELVDGSSDCMGNTVGNITVPCGGNCTSGMGQYAKNNACPSSTEAEIPGKFEDGPEWFKLEEQYTSPSAQLHMELDSLDSCMIRIHQQPLQGWPSWPAPIVVAPSMVCKGFIGLPMSLDRAR